MGYERAEVEALVRKVITTSACKQWTGTGLQDPAASPYIVMRQQGILAINQIALWL
jgi:hypothetical protein